MKRSPLELLAPASNHEAAETAFACGADSVYAGLGRFNARERGENFDLEGLARLLSLAHGQGKKVYLTLNTLLRQDEIPDLIALLEELSPLQPDAVIVQDLGVLRILREGFPGLALHASTQMAVHNAAGIRAVAAMGVERVILERQVDLKELPAIVAGSPIEVEVFAHGALCCSLSGCCLFSSWLGGWSGNRGRCKQPCRRRFHGADGNGFFFSTRDLYTLDLIDEFEDAGVAALKIEGRLRKADYVESVVRAYRLVLDTPRPERPKILGQARALLSGSLGRRWSSGFYRDARPRNLIQHESLGVSGQLCGEIQRSEASGFHLRLSRPIQEYDRIRIQGASGDEGPALTLTRLSRGMKPIRRGIKGETVFVHCDKKVQPRDRVFRIGRETPSKKTARPPLRRGLNLRVHLAGDGLSIHVEGLDAPYRLDRSFPPAERHPLDAEALRDEFRKARTDELAVGRVDVELEGEYFLQQRDLRKLRQAFWTWCCKEVEAGRLGEARRRCSPELQAELEGPLEMDAAFQELTTRLLPPDVQGRKVLGSLVARDWSDPVEADELVLPDYCPESRWAELRSRVRRFLEGGGRRLRLTNLAGLDLLGELGDRKDLVVTASYPLPVANLEAVRELRTRGVHRFMAWIEVDEEAMAPLAEALGGALEVWAFGRPHLLSTRAKPPVEGPITDGRGFAFRVVHEEALSRVYGETPLALPVPKGASSFEDLRHASLDEGESSTFNWEHRWV